MLNFDLIYGKFDVDVKVVFVFVWYVWALIWWKWSFEWFISDIL